MAPRASRSALRRAGIGVVALALAVTGCRAGVHSQAARGPCPAGDPLRGVYHAGRLDVLGTCVRYTGTVRDLRLESDGDHHVYVVPDRGMERFLDEKSRQYGDLVVELLPGQALPLPRPGQRVTFVGTWVHDTQHGWNEIHPVWAERIAGRMRVAPPPVPPRYAGSSAA